MIELKPYYVVSDSPDLKAEIVADLQSASGSDTIPNRVVEITKPMPGSLHTVEAMLTDEEAALLNTDDRIRIVEQDPILYKGIRKGRHASRTGNFSNDPRATLSTDRNYGLDRSTTSTNNFTTLYTSTNHTFNYNLDGTGVDIIVMDTGVEASHPEFAVKADGTGGTRVINYDWTQHGIITSAPTGGFLGDCEGHGSNCASVAAGNTNGWAPGAAIYSLRIIGTGVTTEHDITDGRVLGLVDEMEAWQTILAFHNSKSVTSTGYKRPTIVTCSYAYNDYYKAGKFTSCYYRGTTHSISTTTGVAATQYGTIGAPEGGDGSFGYRYTTVEAEIQSCINAGIIVVAAAGNNAHKIDTTFSGSTGTDYNNYVLMTDNPGVPRPYHQGATPGSCPNVICVGALDNELTSYDVKAYFSATGPRVDIFAPGSLIMGAWSSSSYITAAVQDPRNTTYWLNKISGTSQATPQVTGVIACLLQARPWITAQQVQFWLKAAGLKGLMNEAGYVGSSLTSAWTTGTYTNLASLQGGVNTILFQPFSLPNPLTLHG
jgi:hypothetical protein